MGMFGYKPSGMEMWDTWYLEHEGKLHMFHLQFLSLGSMKNKLEADSLGHAVSENLVHWVEQEAALSPGETGGLDDLQPWTGCVYEKNGIFYLYYTMRSSRNNGKGQHIGLATSDDLEHWHGYPGNPIISPDSRWYISHEQPLPNGVVDCRDLVIVESPDGKGWYGFYAARVHAAELSDGSVIAAVRSYDLLHWEHLPPVFIPAKYACVEVPDVYFLNGRWYMTCLTGNSYGNRGIYKERNITQGTIYAVADSIEGPYRELPEDNLLIAGDETCGYSCRSVSLCGKRYVFYTERMTNTVSPPLEVCTTKKGYLRLKYSSLNEVWRHYTLVRIGQKPDILKLPFSHENWGLPGGTWCIQGDTYIGKTKQGWQIADLGIGSADVEIEATITIIEGIAAGIVWRGNTQAVGCGGNMVFMLDAAEHVVQAGIAPGFGEPWCRHWEIERGKQYHMRVVVRRPRVEIYVDDLLVLQFAGIFSEVVQPSVGFFVDRGIVAISNLAVYALCSD